MTDDNQQFNFNPYLVETEVLIEVATALANIPDVDHYLRDSFRMAVPLVVFATHDACRYQRR